MELFSDLFFTGFYLFSIFSVCRWTYLAHVHNGAGAYRYLSEQKSSFLPDLNIHSAVRTHLEFISILACFIIFVVALCSGLSVFFQWIPDHLSLKLGDGSTLHLSVVFSCLIGGCASMVFGKWIFTGICAYWEKQALARQSDLFFDIVRYADDKEALIRIREQATQSAVQLKQGSPFMPRIVPGRVELACRIIDLRLKEIES